MADVTIPAWFNGNTYMQNKLKALQATDSTITYTKMIDSFTEAGYIDEPGYYQHFLDYGKHEGISPNALFVPDEYLQFKAIQFFTSDDAGDLKTTEANVRANMQYYSHQIKQVFDESGMSAWEHYEQFGGKEGINTSNDFDDSNYIAAKVKALASQGVTATADEVRESIAEAGMTPLTHYLEYKGTSDAEVKTTATFAVPEDEQVGGSSGAEGGKFVLTSAVEYTEGTDNDDTFFAVGGDDAIATNNTLNVGDVIDGKGGTDTLRVQIAGADPVIPAGVTVDNVEILKTYSDGANALDAASVTAAEGYGLNALWQYDLVSAANAAGKFTTLDNAGSAAAGFGATGAAATACKATIADLDFGTTATTGTILLDGIGEGSTIALDAAAATDNKVLSTLNIQGSMAPSTAATADLAVTTNVHANAAGVTTVNLEISSDTHMTFTGAKITKIDAGASTGKLHLDLDGGATAALKVVEGGSGNDTVTVDFNGAKVAASGVTIETGTGSDIVNVKAAAAAGVTGAHTIDLGEGNDTLRLGGAAADYTNAANVTGTDAQILNTALVVKGLTSGDSGLDLRTLDAAATNSTTRVVGAVKDNVDAATTLAGAIAAAVNGTTAGDTVLFSYGGDGYIYTVSAAGVATAGADGLIQLVGVSNIDDFASHIQGLDN